MKRFAIICSLLFASAASAETCRFAAHDKENPFKRWLASPDVLCNGDEHAPGDWNVFARSATAISTDASLELRPAAMLSVKVRDGQRAVAYAPRYGVAYPVTGARSLVPADTELWVFVLQKDAPLGVFTVSPIEASAERELDARVAPPSAVVGWIRVPEDDRKPIDNARGLAAPAVHAGSREAAALSPLALLNGSFVLVRDVPAGTTQLELAGRGWLPQRTPIKVKDAFTAVETPLLAEPTPTLVLNWSSGGDVVALNASIGTCGDDSPVARYAISVSRCASRDSEQCEVIRKEDVPAGTSFGSFATEGLVPGAYRAEMRFGRLPAVTSTIDLAPAQIGTLAVSARYVALYGSLTLGGKALGTDAALKFPGGVGFSGRDGSDYHAVLIDRVPLLGIDARIDINACQGSPKAYVLTDAPLIRPARLNVDIPDNELTINVEDTFTHERISGATVNYTVMSKSMPKRPVIRAKALTTSEAPLRIAYLPERELRIMVTAPGYEKNEVPPFSISKSEKRSLDVQLVPVRGTSAKLISARPFEDATIMWVGASGRIEDTAVAPDGTFTDPGTHGGQVVVVVSASHPLWITVMPRASRREALEMRFPDTAAARTFDVGLSSVTRVARYVGLNIGPLHVPAAALQLHQSLRSLGLMLNGGAPLRIRDIAETAPIEVLLGTNAEEVASRKKLEPGVTKIIFE